MLEGEGAQSPCASKFTWDLSTMSLLDSLSSGNSNSQSQELTFHKFIEDSNEPDKKEDPIECEWYLLRPMDHKRSFPASGHGYCDPIRATLKEMLKEEIQGDSLSSFMGNIAGVPVDVDEMVQEVEQSSKSYETDVEEKYSLRSLLKRSGLAPPALMPLDHEQMKGFQLVSNEDASNYHNSRCTSDSDDGVYDCLAREKMKIERDKKRKKSKIVVTYQKTSGNMWEPKQEPQKIVPIYSEQISGIRGYRRRHRRRKKKIMLQPIINMAETII